MYDPIALKAAFQSLVGVRQPYTPGVPQIVPPLSTSNSGLYVDDKHPLASTENMFYSCPNFEPSQYPTWLSGKNWTAGVAVNVSGVLYIALNNLVNDIVSPSSDATNWALYNPFQVWLQQKYDQASPNLFAALVRKKKIKMQGKAILERQQLYRGIGNQYDKIIPQGRAVGFMFYPQQAEGLWVLLDKIGIQLTNAQMLDVYLYHSSQEDWIGKWTYSATGGGTFTWQGLTSPTNIMKYLQYDTSGSYQFIWYEADLTGGNTAIEKKWNCSAIPCPGCDGVDTAWYNLWSRYTTIRNIQFPSTALDLVGRTIPDQSQIVFDQLTNWGMNFSITVRCDLTDFIVSNLNLWADAFAVQVCKEFLEAIANGIRIGPSPAQTKLSAIAALDEKAPGNWITRNGGYNDTLEALNIDFSGFSSSCMPCEQKNKVKFFSM